MHNVEDSDAVALPLDKAGLALLDKPHKGSIVQLHAKTLASPTMGMATLAGGLTLFHGHAFILR